MIYKLYSVYDKKAQNYTSPTCIVNNAVATRLFNSMVEQQKNEPSTEDLELYCVGKFDSEKGLLCEVFDKPQYVCSSLDYLNESVENGGKE